MLRALFCARRSLLTQEGICLQLRPDFHFLEVAYPYIARRLLTDEDPALRERLFQVPPLIFRTIAVPSPAVMSWPVLPFADATVAETSCQTRWCSYSS